MNKVRFIGAYIQVIMTFFPTKHIKPKPEINEPVNYCNSLETISKIIKKPMLLSIWKACSSTRNTTHLNGNQKRQLKTKHLSIFKSLIFKNYETGSYRNSYANEDKKNWNKLKDYMYYDQKYFSELEQPKYFRNIK